FNASKGTSLEGRLVDVASRLLVDPDLEVRRGVVDIVQQFPQMFNPVLLFETLETHPNLFEDVAGGVNKPDLASGLLRAVAAHPSSNERVINRLRQAAVDPRNGGWVLAGVATNGADCG